MSPWVRHFTVAVLLVLVAAFVVLVLGPILIDQL